MSITYPTTWSLLQKDELTHGRPVAVGVKDELAGLAESQTRQMTGNVRKHCAVLSCLEEDAAGVRGGVPGLDATVRDVANGRIRLWSDTQRLQLIYYGSYVQVYLYVGGIYLGWWGAGVLGWVTGSIVIPTGAVIDADGFADIRLAARTVTGDSALIHAGVSEVTTFTTDLPDGNENWTELAAFDDSVFTADQPLDAWAVQQIDDNAKWTNRNRSRGLCHLYPRTNPHYLSSIFWRADGPYMIAAQPWAEIAEVTISVEADADGGWVFCMSEWERFEDVADDRAVEITGAFEHHTFQVKIQPGIDREQKIWVLFKSNRNYLLVNTYNAYRVESRLSRLYSGALPPSFQAMSWGDIFEGGLDEGTLTVTGKGTLSYGLAKQSWDVGAYLGDVSLVTRSLSLISPHILTGLVDSAQLNEIYDSSTSVAYSPNFEHRRIGVMELTAVLLEAMPEVPVRQKTARPGDLPSAAIITSALEAANTAAVWGTSQLAIRHWGWRNFRGNSSASGAIINLNEGTWTFVPASAGSSQTLPIYLPVFVDPSGAPGAGMVPQKMYGRVTFYAVTTVAQSLESTADVECFFKVGGTDYDSPDGGTVEEVLIAGVDSSGIAQVTLGDALLAATCTVVDTSGPATPTQTEHAYTQQYTWPKEVNNNNQFWQVSAKFEAPLPASYPAEIQVKIKFTPASGSAILVVSGLHVWTGPRLEP